MGAGDAGELLIREIKNNKRLGYIPIGFIDDDPEKMGKIIHGMPVLGNRQGITELTKKHDVKKIFIAILSEDKTKFNDVFEISNKLSIDCKFIRTLIE